MFPAPHLSVDDLSWTPVGPGPDPAVLVEAWMVVNDATFRLLGFRVPMPYSVGWTRSAYWEDDKALQGDGLLWDVEGFKDFVRRVDEAPDDTREPITVEGETVHMDEDMARLALTWQALSGALRWTGQDWRPAVIDGQPYILVGYPEGPARSGLPSHRIELGAGRNWIGKPDRQHHFNMRIHGAICGIACSEVRALQLGDQQIVRPLNGKAADWIAEVDAVIDALPGASTRAAFRVDGRAMYGMIAPVDVEMWSFDAHDFVTAVGAGLPLGRMRWALDLPLGEVDTAVAQLLEGLSEAVRTRTLSRAKDELYFACRLSDAARLLGLTAPPDDMTALRALLYARLGKVTLRALGRRANDTSCLFLGRVVEKIYIFPDTLYLCLSRAFVHLALGIGRGALLELQQGNVLLETGIVDDVGRLPDWTADLPLIVDRPIRQLLEEFENGVYSADD